MQTQTYISTNLDLKRTELIAVDDEGAIVFQVGVRSFMDVLIKYHGYRADVNKDAPPFSEAKARLERQWNNLPHTATAIGRQG